MFTSQFFYCFVEMVLAGDVEDTDVFADHLLPQDNSNTTFNEDCRSFIRFSKVSDKFRLVR